MKNTFKFDHNTKQVIYIGYTCCLTNQRDNTQILVCNVTDLKTNETKDEADGIFNRSLTDVKPFNKLNKIFIDANSNSTLEGKENFIKALETAFKVKLEEGKKTFRLPGLQGSFTYFMTKNECGEAWIELMSENTLSIMQFIANKIEKAI